MNENWEVNSMMEFDHHQNIARAAFGDMLYDNERVNIILFILKNIIKILFKFFPTESVIL